MKTLKNLKNYLLILLIGVVVGGISIFFMTREKSEPEITQTSIQEQLQSSAELITTKYFYTKIGKFENSLEMNGWTIPLTNKFFILTFEGEADLGVDLSKVEVDVKENNIHIQLPKVEILNNTIDENSIEIYDESKNIFNPISVDDYKKFAVSQKKVIEKEIEEKNVYKKAEENTKQIIRSILNKDSNIHNNYEIDIQF